MHEIYFLYGNTCSGKDTVANYLKKKNGLNYVSFGNSKRLEISKQTKIGIILEKQIREGKPITPEIGADLMAKSLIPGSNVVSGFPISEDELIAFKNLAKDQLIIRGVIELKVDYDLAKERFFNRKICPICQTPGLEGDFCQKDKKFLVTRIDCTEEEFNFRMKLYQERIEVFLKSQSLKEYPRFTLEVAGFSKEQLAEKVRVFILKNQRKETYP